MNTSISIPSVRSNIKLVESFILDIHDKLQLQESVLDRIMISITEVVNNGIIHGNSSDPEKKVFIGCVCYDDRIEFTIRDEGHGFRPDDIPDPLHDSNILKEGGRGVLIVRSMMDAVDFKQTKEGMEVRLSIRRRDD